MSPTRRVATPVALFALLSSLILPARPLQVPALARGADASAAGATPAAAATPLTPEQAREAYGRVGMSFEANRGQTDEQVKFISRGGGYTLFLTQEEAVFVLARRSVEHAEGQPGEAAAAVDYATTDGTANDRGDYTTAIGRLRFDAGETAKSFLVFVTDDTFAEGNETLQITLSNPSSGAQVGGSPAVNLTILDNDVVTGTTNRIDTTLFFIRQHYVDFFNRQPDSPGLAFWTDNIESCGADAACRENKRTETSAAFFLSIEFQETGFLAHRLYRASSNRLPRYREFIRDAQESGRGVVVGQAGWESQLEANKQAFADVFVTRAEFTAVYGGLTNAQYVDALNANTGARSPRWNAAC